MSNPGVAGFLIISGFSIHSSYAREPEGYLVRRVRRIYPVYVTAVLLGLFPFLILGNHVVDNSGVIQHPTMPATIGTVLMLGTFVACPFHGNPVLWTVQVEFVFYLLAPILARQRREVRWLAISTSALFYCAIRYWPGPFAGGCDNFAH